MPATTAATSRAAINLDQATFDSVLLGGNGPQGSDLHVRNKETVDSPTKLGLKYRARAVSLHA
jgi:hypothetical protein